MKDKNLINLFNRIHLFAILSALMLLTIGCSKTDTNKPVIDELEVSRDITPIPETRVAIDVTVAPDMQTWTKLSDMSTQRCSPGMASIDGKIYVVGGWNLQNGLNILGSTEEYNPETVTWTNKADLLEKRNNFGIASLNGYLYTIGGAIKNTNSNAANLFIGTNTVEKFDPVTDQWIKVQGLNGSSSYVGQSIQQLFPAIRYISSAVGATPVILLSRLKSMILWQVPV